MFQVSPEFRQRVAMIESNNNPNAKNPNSSAKGKYQFIDSTAKAYGLADPFNEQEADKAFDQLTKDNYTILSKSLKREPTEAELYLAHQQGAGGALNLLRNPNAKAADVVGRDAIKLNGGRDDMTAADFAGLWTQKYDGVKPQTTRADQIAWNEPSQSQLNAEQLIFGQMGARNRMAQGQNQPIEQTASLPMPQSDAMPPQPQPAQSKPRIARIQTPDGRIARFEVPEGMSPEDVQAFAEQQFGNQNPVQPQEEPGFTDRVTARAAERGQQLQVIDSETAAGNQSVYEQALQRTGNAAGLIGDIATEGFKSVGNALSSIIPDAIETPVRQVVSDGINRLGNTGVGRTVRGAADEITAARNSLAKDSPRTARNLDATTNIGLLGLSATPVKGVSVAGAAVDAAEAGTKAVIRTADNAITKSKNALEVRAANKAAKTNPSTASANLAKDSYAEVDRLGVKIEPTVTQKMNFSLNRMRPQDPAKAELWDKSGAQDYVNMLNRVSSKGELSISGASAIRSDINAEIQKAFRAGEKTRAGELQKIKATLTNAITDPKAVSPSDYKGKNAWITANHEFAKKSVLEDIEEMAEEAAGRAQPANSLDTAINKYLRDDVRSAGLKPDERKLLEEVTAKTHTGELLKSGATRLIPAIGAGVGGAPGFLVGHYGSMLSRSTAESLKLKKLDKVYEAIQNRKAPDMVAKPEAPKLLTNQRKDTVIKRRTEQVERDGRARNPIIQAPASKQNLLPSPDKMTPLERLSNGDMVVDKSGAARKQSPLEALSAQGSRERAKQLGMTPDVSRNLSRIQVRDKMGSVWDKIDEQSKKKIESDINKAYQSQSKPLSQIIKDAKNRAEKLAQETGDKPKSTTMSDALLKAKKKK